MFMISIPEVTMKEDRYGNAWFRGSIICLRVFREILARWQFTFPSAGIRLSPVKKARVPSAWRRRLRGGRHRRGMCDRVRGGLHRRLRLVPSV
jgi:hypothetical protein